MLTLGLYGVTAQRNGLSAHDHGLALMRGGRVLASIELERVTGRKHDNRLDHYFDALVAPWLSGGEPVRIAQVNSFLGGSFKTHSGSLELLQPASVPLEDLLVPTDCRTTGQLAHLKVEAYTVPHELAHVGSCLPFYGPPRPQTLLVHVDGGASVSASSAWFWDGEQLRLVESSWDALKTAVNNFNANALSARMLGLEIRDHLSMPGKLMAFASHGTTRPALMDWLRENEFFLHSDDPDLLSLVARHCGRSSGGDPTRQADHQDIAACMQTYFEEQVLSHLQRLKRSTGARFLCYAGGAALNVHANTRIERELGFEDVCLPPAPSDCGLALGAAAITEWLSGETIGRHGPYLTRLSPQESLHLPPVASARSVARKLADGDVVAAVIGHAEVGPRALGHRSLFARPDSVELRRDLSERMKGREWYRPVAPVLLPDTAAQCLEGYSAGSPLARFMLGAWRVKPEWTPAFKGCLHADGSVRSQVVDTEDPEQAALAELLYVLRERHGIQGLINTSLNTRGHPIAHATDDAVDQARKLGVAHVWRA